MSLHDPAPESAETHETTLVRHGRETSWALPVTLGIVLYLCLYGVFFPPIYASPDEKEFLTTANAIKTGTVFDRDCDDVYRTDEKAGGVRRFKGRSFVFSAILACLLPIHWKATFLVGLVFHLLTFTMIGLALSKSGRSPWWAWLVLFHPTLTLLSRCIASDVPAMAAVALVLVLLLVEPRRPAAAGLVAGLSLFIRFTNCWLGLAAGVQLLRDDLTRQKGGHVGKRLWRGDLRRFLLPYVCLCVGLLAMNTVLYGGPFQTYYAGGEGTVLGFSNLVRRLPFYLLALSVIWPAMPLAALFLPRRLRLFGVTLMVVQLLFFSSIAAFNPGGTLARTLVRCLRYFMGTIVVLCVGYPGLVDWLVRRRRIPVPLAAVVLVGCVGATALLFRTHSRYLARQARVVAEVYALTPDNATPYIGSDARELFCPVFGERKVRSAIESFIKHRFQDVRAGDFFVFYVQPPPRSPGQKANARIAERVIADLGTVFEIRQMQTAKEARGLRIFEAKRRRPNVYLDPLTENELRVLFPRAGEMPLFGKS